MSADLQRCKVYKLSPLLLQIINITTLGGEIVSSSDVHIQEKKKNKNWRENNDTNNHKR